METIKNFYIKLIAFGSSLESLFLLAVRLFWGYLFYQTGSGKLERIDSVSDFFYSLGIPFAEFNAQLVAWTETLGGIFLILGLASRLISIPLIITMAVAMLIAHLDKLSNFFVDPSVIVESSPFTFLLSALIILIFGPGIFSLDGILEKLLRSKKNSKVK